MPFNISAIWKIVADLDTHTSHYTVRIFRLDGKEEALGWGQPSILTTVNNLGLLYTDQEKPGEPEDMSLYTKNVVFRRTSYRYLRLPFVTLLYQSLLQLVALYRNEILSRDDLERRARSPSQNRGPLMARLDLDSSELQFIRAFPAARKV